MTTHTPPFPLFPPTADGSVLEYSMMPDGSVHLLTNPDFEPELITMYAQPGEIIVTIPVDQQPINSPLVTRHVHYSPK